MVFYYEPIYHENASDKEENVLELYSSREEPKTVVSIVLLGWTNEGILRVYREKEKLGEIPTGASTIQLPIEIPIDLELPEGQRAIITLQNRISGTNAKIIGYVKYIIR